MSLPYFDECIEFQYAYITMYIVRSEKKNTEICSGTISKWSSFNLIESNKEELVKEKNREEIIIHRK